MRYYFSNKLFKICLGAGLIHGLSGCHIADQLEQIGSPPPVAPIVDPTAQPEYKPVNLPMPETPVAVNNPNSLWQGGQSRGFFKDQRAGKIGDILTVNINIKDEATTNNKSTRKRNNVADTTVTNVLGRPLTVIKKGVTTIADVKSNPSESGEGTIARSEEVKLNVSAVITQILPNGNLVISGSQQVLINFERRDLKITGVIRREDISSKNSIPFEKVAEARLSYGGEGQISDFQQPPMGQQLLDILLPF